MRAYDCIWRTSQMLFKHLVGKKHLIYCIAMTFFFSTDLNANTFLIPRDQFSLFVLKNCSYISKY